jgi:hypothetical protein
MSFREWDTSEAEFPGRHPFRNSTTFWGSTENVPLWGFAPKPNYYAYFLCKWDFCTKSTSVVWQRRSAPKVGFEPKIARDFEPRNPLRAKVKIRLLPLFSLRALTLHVHPFQNLP